MADDTDILDAVRGHADGVAMSALVDRVGGSRRALQNRVAAMVARGALRREGRGPATRYRMPDAGSELALGPDALKIQAAVMRPRTERAPVGYHRAYLDAYIPNVTRYLERETAAALAARGHRGSTQHAGTYARQIYDRLLIDLSWSSSRLEGNTYSLLDTEALLRDGQHASGKSARETQMILNHKGAIEFLVENASKVAFDRYTVQSLHALLAQNLLPDPAAEGRLRTISVRVGGSVFLPLDVPQLVEEVFEQVLDTAEAINDPIEQALFVLVHLPYLQPFDDVNKRVSRLAANIPLIRNNLCPLSFLDVPTELYVHGILGVYELNRMELLRDLFVWAYERSCQTYAAIRQTLGDPDPFRLRFRLQLRDIIGDLVRRGIAADDEPWLREAMVVANVPVEHQVAFRQVVHEELAALHMGNIARYRLRPSEFESWQV